MRNAQLHNVSRPELAVVGTILALAACAPLAVNPASRRLAPTPVIVAASAAEVAMSPKLSADLDSMLNAAIADRAAPGASLVVGRYGRQVHLRGYGKLDTAAASPAVDANSIYDLASLTKVVATTTAAMILEEAGKLDLRRTVASYLPEFNAPEKAQITVRMLFEHSGGLEAYAQLFREFRGRDQYLQQINARPLRAAPGTTTVYSDWDLILAQLILERLSGQTLDAFVSERVFRPLGMTSTMFNPDSSLVPRIAPTEIDTARGGLVRARVHDENAFAMGGVSGHAGLFSTARDLAVFAHMLMNGGEYGGVRIVKATTVARWTAPQNPQSSRALGWDTPSRNSSAGRYFSPRSFGHTGFTGTSMWMDPEKGVFVILLTNRVNPTRDNNKHVPLRRAVADAVQAAVLDVPLIDWEARR